MGGKKRKTKWKRKEGEKVKEEGEVWVGGPVKRWPKREKKFRITGNDAQ